MEKSLQLEIENEYKTQIQELEENLKQIGEFEASVKPAIYLKTFLRIINALFSLLFILLALAIVIALLFFLNQSIGLFSKLPEMKSVVQQWNGETDSSFVLLFKYTLYGFAGILVLISYLLRIIRKKNNLIINIGVIASDFKIRAIKMLEITKERFKGFSITVANDRRI